MGITTTPTFWVFLEGSKELMTVKPTNHLQMTGWLLRSFHTLLYFPHFPYALPHSKRPCPPINLAPSQTGLLPTLHPAPSLSPASQYYFPVDFPSRRNSENWETVPSCAILRKCPLTERSLETLSFPEQFQYWHRMARNSQVVKIQLLSAFRPSGRHRDSVSFWASGLRNPGPASPGGNKDG